MKHLPLTHGSKPATEQPTERPRIDLAELRSRLESQQGPGYWRSLDELADTPEFRETLEREFADATLDFSDGISRRNFVKLMGASLALAGLSGCTRQPPEKIVPYVKQPEELVPGKPQYYATTLSRGGYGVGVLAESHLGRPTKLEGNPDHPASLGASDAWTQAAVLGLYDPDRSQHVTELGLVRNWDALAAKLRPLLEAQQGLEGAGLRVLTGAIGSPSLAWQLEQLQRRFPKARWHQWEPVGRRNALRAAVSGFGRPLDTRYRLERADVLLSLDADLFGSAPGAVRYAREFAERRRPENMNRFYALESAPSVTGALADHRLPLKPSLLAACALELARLVGVAGVAAPEGLEPRLADWLQAAARDLGSHRGRSLVVAGDGLPAELQLLVHAINHQLANVGQTLEYTEPVLHQPVDELASLEQLVSDLNAGRVDLLVMLDPGNPVYSAPPELGFAEALQQARLRVHLGLYADETAEYCQWHVPATHELESWGDARAYDGSLSLVQPLIQPLYGGHTPQQLLSLLLGEPSAEARALVEQAWRQLDPRSDFERYWRRVLHDGLVADSAHRPLEPELDAGAVAMAAGALAGRRGAEIELSLRLDSSVHDGRYANNGWLQELPRPLTKLTWDNAALMAPALAERLGLSNEDVVAIEHAGRRLELPVWVVPGHADGAVSVSLGYGRRRAGRVGNGVGHDAYQLRTREALDGAVAVTLIGSGRRQRLASTQDHHSMEGRELARVTSVERLRQDPESVIPKREWTRKSLYPGWDYSEGNAWALNIDLNACTGCNACVVACQSENNIPIVGKQEVLRGRELHWIRIDRYFEGGLDEPELHHQPVLCMHCEQAPCEAVCPVSATVHSDEGLNDMVYNRCVGTRYCSNNCPYKVRRFNFFDYNDRDNPVLDLGRNPDVTVRVRGVMEKCSYCVQRINSARIGAKVEGRPIADGEVKTACQQACPTGAIVFGNQNDPEARIRERQQDARNYVLLEELGTRPRTSYLARIRNPNPELESV